MPEVLRMISFKPSRRATLVLAAVAALFALGLIVRWLGLRLGLPYFHHWDEVWVTSSARSMLMRGDDVPTSYQYGAPLSRWIVLAVRAREALGLEPAIAPGDEIALRWTGRLIGAAVSASGTIAMFVAGRAAAASVRDTSPVRVGLCAAAGYAFAYELVTHARYAVTDASLVAFAAWSLAFTALWVERRSLVLGLLSVLFAGIGFSLKPTGLPLLMLPLSALVLVGPRPGSPRPVFHRLLLASAAPLFFACFLFFNPHYIDRWSDALRDVTVRIAQTRNGGFPRFLLREPGLDHLGSALWGLFGHTFSRYVPVACLLASVACAGVFVALRARSVVMLVAVLHAGATVLAIAWPNKTFLLRNYLVAVPCLCLAAGFALDRMAAWTRARSASRLAEAAVPVLVLGAAAIATIHDAARAQALAVDARFRALAWIEARGHQIPVRVALTPSVAGAKALGGSLPLSMFARPGIEIAGEVGSCGAVGAQAPDYVIVASNRGGEGTWSPYRELWDLTACPGYEQRAAFEASPYEHTYWVTETWDGRASAVILGRVE